MSESIHGKKLRVRPPRVNLTYGIEAGGVPSEREIPFVIGVLANLGGTDRAELRNRRFLQVDRDNFDQVMTAIGPSVSIDVPNRLDGAGTLSLALSFNSMRDFEPERLLETITPLRDACSAPRDGDSHHRIAAQLDEILHCVQFQELEASWRALAWLVDGWAGDAVFVRALDVSKRELLRDFEGAAEFTGSSLWRLAYEYEYGVFEGDPYALLIGDYEFDRGARDVALLSHIAGVAEASNTPFVAGASPEMFGVDQFAQLADRRNPTAIFDKSNPENTKWLSFRNSEASRWVGLTLPRCLLRSPHRVRPEREGDLAYAENHGEGSQELLWGNAAFAFASRLAEAFHRHHWCAAFLGDNGGIVQELPRRPGSSPAPIEVGLGDAQEQTFRELGFIPLLCHKHGEHVVFYGGASCQKPPRYDSSQATVQAALMSRFPYLMTTSRFAHYLRAITRDSLGSFKSREECEHSLNAWISQYASDTETLSQAAAAARPLSAASVQVVDDETLPGAFKAIIYLRPRFQIGELDVSFKLVVDLPEAVHF